MLGPVTPRRLLAAFFVLALAPSGGRSQDDNGAAARSVTAPVPRGTETLHYSVEWRLITAGTVRLTVSPSGTPEYPSLHSELDLASVGLVSKLYKVDDKYFGNYDPGFCAVSAQMSTIEGRRRRQTRVTYDRANRRADYLERDLVKNATVHAGQIDIPACVHDVVGGLLALRTLNVEVGKSIEIPISDGRKSAMVRVEAQEREDVKINNRVHKTVRYEAFLFNNVIFSRNARLLLWLTDDPQKTPVQIRVRMNFPIGTVTLSLDKIEAL
jgi:hypothetical protein